MKHGEPYKIIKKCNVGRSGNQKLSRYKNLGVMLNTNNTHYLESPKKRTIRESPNDKLYVVESGFENRIDMVSFKFYNTPHLWWVIAEVNHIINPMKLEVGITLRIPPLDEISL